MAKNEKTQTSFDEKVLKTTAEEALTAVKNAGSRAEDLVQAWVNAANAAAVQEISERGDGAIRKAARRGLNILRARRVEIPPLRRVATLPESEELLEGWMMAPDSSGMQLFAVSARAPSGRYRVAFVFLHGAQGIARVENSSMSQSQLKEYFAKVLPGAGYTATRVPVPWARFRVAEARRIHRERGFPEPLGFTTAEPLLGKAPIEAAPHPFDDEGFELADDDAAELAKGSGLLHNVPEFRSWLPSTESMQEMLIQVGQKLTPGETPEPSVVTDHLRTETEAATDRFFSPEVRTEFLRRMKDSALSALARDGEQRALEIAAAMKIIERCGLVTNPPRDVPFLRAFFDKAVAMMLAQGGGKLRIPVPTAGLSPAAPDAAGGETTENPASPA